MKLFHFFYLPFCLGIISTAHAKIFTSTGIGDTPELAKKDAISNAIKLGVGEMIVSKEELNNEQFTQKIVSYSDAYVKKVAVKSQVKLPGGVYESQVEVDIEGQKLTQQLEQMNISTMTNPIDNEEMLSVLNQIEQVDTNKKTVEDAVKMAKTLLVDYVSEDKPLMNVEIIDRLRLRKDEVDPNAEYFPFSLTLKVTANKEYAKLVEKAITILSQLSELKDLDAQKYRHGDLPIRFYNLSKGTVSPKDISFPMLEEQKKMLISEMELKLKPHKLIIDLIDKENNIMQADDRERYERYINRDFVSSIKNKNGKEIEDEMVFNRDFVNIRRFFEQVYPYYGIDQYAYQSFHFATGEATFRIKIYLTKEEMANIKDIKVYFAEVKSK